MTTITYRNTGKERLPLHSGGSVFAQFSAQTRRLADWWQRRQNIREIESMPFDMRKDFGWPATDTSGRRKRMQ